MKAVLTEEMLREKVDDFIATLKENVPVHDDDIEKIRVVYLTAYCEGFRDGGLFAVHSYSAVRDEMRDEESEGVY